MAHECLHFLQRVWKEINNMDDLYGTEYSLKCIVYMKRIIKLLERKVQLHERKKKAGRF